MSSHYYMVLSVLSSHIFNLLTTLTHWIIFPCLEHFVHLAFRTTRFLVFLLLSLAVIFIGFDSSLQLPRWWIEDSTFSTYISFFGRLILSQYITFYLYIDEYHISVSSPNRASDPYWSSSWSILLLLSFWKQQTGSSTFWMLRPKPLRRSLPYVLHSQCTVIHNEIWTAHLFSHLSKRYNV